MFYSWNVSLTAPGALLAGRALVDRLGHYRGTQLATYGYTGVPLVAACVAAGGGQYTGLCVRESPKGHGSGRQIEGPVDPCRPVVLVDDSLSSGTSARKGIDALEAEGLTVEGVVALVHFPHRGGRERLRGLGYRVDTIFDVWDDLELPRPEYVAAWTRVGEVRWQQESLEEGLHPAVAARRVAERYLATGSAPLPPSRLDRAYDARGGTYVSFRERASDARLARDGFWHFTPGEADPCRDVVLATVKTLRASRIRADELDRLKIGVSFLGPLEEIGPSLLDFSRYGIVVRSKSWATKVGGALPNTQVFTSEREQYDLALRNAQIGPFEPHELYRHDLEKHVEPGQRWLPYGGAEGIEAAWPEDSAIGEALTSRALAVAAADRLGNEPPRSPLRNDLIPVPVAAVVVTLYAHGRVVGCHTGSRETLDECVVRATQASLRDERFRRSPLAADDELVAAVAVLYDEEQIGETDVVTATRKLRLGLDSLLAASGERAALYLASVAVHRNWSKETLGRRLLEKAGIEGDRAAWATYRTASWLGAKGAPAHRQVFGFVERTPADPTVDIELLAGYLIANLEPETGLPAYAQAPVDGTRWPTGTGARVLHALAALHLAGERCARAEWLEAARRGFEACLEHLSTEGDDVLRLPDTRCGPLADCELLYGLCLTGLAVEHPAAAERLLARVSSLVRPEGWIAHAGARRLRADHDFLPGSVLLALAEAAAQTAAPLDPAVVERAFVWYRRRFRNVGGWGLAAWHMTAWARMWDVLQHPAHAAFVCELADWAVQRQLEATGAFLTDLSPGGPSFHTAFVAEGIAAAWRVAAGVGDAERATRYARSCRRAASLTARLVVRPEDAPVLPDPARAVGGVRGTLDSSFVRIDFVSHALAALVTAPPATHELGADIRRRIR